MAIQEDGKREKHDKGFGLIIGYMGNVKIIIIITTLLSGHPKE